MGAVLTAVLALITVAGALATPAEAASVAPIITAVGSLVTHTNQPSQSQELIAVAPAAAGDILTLAVETKFPGTPAFTAASVQGGGVATWTKVTGYLTIDGTHGQELWQGKVTSPGPSSVTVVYSSGSASGTSESATSLDVQEFASSVGGATVWSVDKTGLVDNGTSSTAPTYPTLIPTTAGEAYVGYLAVPGSVWAGPTPGVRYQTDARYNQTVYDVSVSGTITPVAASPSQTFSSIGMLLRASTTPDAIAPSVPLGVAVNGAPTASRVTLSWSPSTDDPGGSGVAGYRIYRNGSSSALNPALDTTSSYTDAAVVAGTTYSYAVSAVDAAGNESARSAAVVVTTPAAVATDGKIVNGGFESGSLSGWTVTGASAGVTSTSHSGAFAGVVGSSSPTNGVSSLSQTFTAAPGTSSLSFWWKMYCPDSVTYDWATASLADLSTGTTRTLLAPTCTRSTSWQQVTGSVTAGHRYTVVLSNRDENYPGDATFTRYDDVVLR